MTFSGAALKDKAICKITRFSGNFRAVSHAREGGVMLDNSSGVPHIYQFQCRVFFVTAVAIKESVTKTISEGDFLLIA